MTRGYDLIVLIATAVFSMFCSYFIFQFFVGGSR